MLQPVILLINDTVCEVIFGRNRDLLVSSTFCSYVTGEIWHVVTQFKCTIGYCCIKKFLKSNKSVLGNFVDNQRLNSSSGVTP